MLRQRNNAFTLVELSIVLVILGLLAGGILAGKSLIRSAETRSVIADIDKYKTSIQAFRDKYLAIPGDMTNATSFWGAKNADLATCLTSPVDGTKTCNGNGDGTYNYVAILHQIEMFLAWQHLANAGLVEGTYSGLPGPAGEGDAVIGVNIPESHMQGGGYTLNYVTSYSGHASWFDGSLNGNVITFGADVASNQFQANSAILTPQEAWNIDVKTDDGNPVTGRTFAPQKKNSSARPNCTTADDKTALYNLADPSVWCYLNFSLAGPYRPT